VGYNAAPEGWWQKFVTADPPRTAKLAVVRADGSPHVVPVWVDLDRGADGDEIVFTTGLETVKGRALQREDRVSLCWDDAAPPFNFVSIRGRARLVDDPAQVRAWAGRLGARYMGAARAAEYAARNGVPGEVVVRVRPERVVAMVDVAE
jgi:PPOX class probable F420-dependent enzyme